MAFEPGSCGNLPLGIGLACCHKPGGLATKLAGLNAAVILAAVTTFAVLPSRAAYPRL